jgi:hypothetical protein
MKGEVETLTISGCNTPSKEHLVIYLGQESWRCQAWFLFDAEDGGDAFLRNVDTAT